jgi:phenylacetate-CoA ligase
MMSFQQWVMSRRSLANQVMSRVPPAAHEKNGCAYALRVARAAIAQTQAYPAFLKEQLGHVPKVTSMNEFRKLPLMDKHNYINYERHSLAELALGGDLSAAYTIEKSSGHSGNCYYWLRTPKEDAMFPSYMEFAFAQFYGIETKKTLVLVTLALGTWTSGEKMAHALRKVAATGKYPLTVMAPGMKSDEVIEICRDISPQFNQTVIVGYPPFVKSVLDEGQRRGLDWKALGIRIVLGGEGYSEPWRDRVAERIGVDPDRDLLAVSGGYGAADVGMSMGREYPLTVLIRRLAMRDQALASKLFFKGKEPDGNLPSFVQYNPATCFAEEIDGELVFTALSGIPVVRYNIHDRGGVLPFHTVMQTVHDAGYDPIALLAERGHDRRELRNLPFFYCFGRSDGTVTVNGANVYPEHIQAALSLAADTDVLGFRMQVEHDPKTQDERLVIMLEHHADAEATPALAEHYRNLLVDGLLKLNTEYRYIHERAPHLTAPIVTVHPRATGPFTTQASRIKRVYR